MKCRQGFARCSMGFAKKLSRRAVAAASKKSSMARLSVSESVVVDLLATSAHPVEQPQVVISPPGKCSNGLVLAAAMPICFVQASSSCFLHCPPGVECSARRAPGSHMSDRHNRRGGCEDGQRAGGWACGIFSTGRGPPIAAFLDAGRLLGSWADCGACSAVNL